MSMDGKEKKTPKRWAYLNAFALDDEGNYGYCGASYAYNSATISRKRFLVRLWTAGILAAGAVIAAGCIPAPGMDNSFYVILPYVGEVAFAGSLIWALVRMTAAGDPLRSYIYESTVEKIPGRAVATMVFAGIGLVGGIVNLILRGVQHPIWSIIMFFVLKLLAGISTYVIKSSIMCVEWRKQTHRLGI